MRLRILTALCLAALLSGCTGTAPPTAAQFPQEYALVFRLDAYVGEVLTSSHQFTAVRTAQGLYRADSAGPCCLFLRQGEGQYALYTRHPGSGRMEQNPDVLLSEAAARQLGDLVCPLALLCRDTGGLEAAGRGQAAGRDCLVFRSGSGPGQRTYWVDLDTGLALRQAIFLPDGAGTLHTYIITCQMLRTAGIILPTAG